MPGSYPRWDVTEFLNTEERVCLYLKAAADDDTGSGDTIRLAWRDVMNARGQGRVSIEIASNLAGLTRLLEEHGVENLTTRKITRALLTSRSTVA